MLACAQVPQLQIAFLCKLNVVLGEHGPWHDEKEHDEAWVEEEAIATTAQHVSQLFPPLILRLIVLPWLVSKSGLVFI